MSYEMKALHVNNHFFVNFKKEVAMMNKKIAVLLVLLASLFIILFSITQGLANDSFNFTTIDYPNAIYTQALGINNNGEIAGTFLDANNMRHGFMYSGGSFTVFDYPGTVPDYPGLFGGTVAQSINDSGQIVGLHGPTSLGIANGFLYSGGSFISIPTMPGSIATGSMGINNAAQIVGNTEDYTGMGGIGFMYYGGNFTAIIYPAPGPSTSAIGINNFGQIVGYYYDTSNIVHGFLLSGGIFTPINFVSTDGVTATMTMAHSINDPGQIVGSYFDSVGKVHGFLLQANNFTTVDIPNSTVTEAWGINNAGQIVGYYFDSSGIIHGFLATATTPQKPIALCKNVTISVGSTCNANASIDNGSYDPDGNQITLSQSPDGPYPLGNTQVTLTVTNSKGASSQCAGTVTVIDNSAPTISTVSVSPSVLWPPNHKMVAITVNYSAADNCDAPTCEISSVTSNEPISSSDYAILDAHHVNLIAERLGRGNGRVYNIGITCTDASGNSSNQSVPVTVPHDQGKK